MIRSGGRRAQALGAGCAALLAAGCAAPAAPSAVGRALPPVELVTPENAPARLDALVAGRPALVSFWATWCAGCAGEVEALNRLQDRIGGDGAVVVGVSVGQDRETVAAYARSRGLRYPQLVDEEFRLADELGQRAVPATLVIDRAGHVVFTGGALDERGLAALRAAMEAPGAR